MEYNAGNSHFFDSSDGDLQQFFVKIIACDSPSVGGAEWT
jgi:hypothetical protein